VIVRHGLKAQAESCYPFRRTGQGVCFCGKVNLFNRVAKAKATSSQPSGEEHRTKVRVVTGARPETARSSPGQGEAEGNLGGGPLEVLFQSVLVTWG
jgi:hypothetical protein